MSKPCVHHWLVETPEQALTRWKRLNYELGTPKKEHRKLKGSCRKCGKVRHHLVDGGIKPFTAKRRKKGDGVGSTWLK